MIKQNITSAEKNQKMRVNFTSQLKQIMQKYLGAMHILTKLKQLYYETCDLYDKPCSYIFTRCYDNVNFFLKPIMQTLGIV